MNQNFKVESSPILMKIQMLAPNLSKAEQRVANFALRNPNKVISLSVAGLAECSGVSDATVVRACKSLGFCNYQEFKIALARDTVSPMQSIHTEVTSQDTPEDVIEKVFQENIRTLQYTYATLSSEAVVRAAGKLCEASHVMIFGLGSSAAIAMDLQHKLLRLGISAYACSDPHLQEIMAVSCKSGDVVFTVSQSGSSIDAVESTRHCRENGAYVISLTNIGKTPLSKISDISLTTASHETEYHLNSIASRIAQMTIIDCLYTLIALSTPEITENFYQIDKALRRKKY